MKAKRELLTIIEDAAELLKTSPQSTQLALELAQELVGNSLASDKIIRSGLIPRGVPDDVVEKFVAQYRAAKYPVKKPTVEPTM